MSAQSKPPSGGEEIILDGDMDLDTLIAELEAKKAGVARPPAIPKAAAKPAPVAAPPEPELVIPQAPEPVAESIAEPVAEAAEAAPANDELEMVNLDEEPAPPASPAGAPADTELEMVEVDSGGTDDVEIVDVDAKPVPPPAAPLPDWLGDEIPAKPLVERPALAVDLSAPLPDAELDLRHEFQRETRPDPKYLFEETKELAKEDAGEVTYILCHKCGARNQIGVWVCRNCGDKLRISQEILNRYYQEQ